jgi:hypothetical protein
VEGAKQAGRFTLVGEIDDAIDDEPNLFSGCRQAGAKRGGHAEFGDVPCEEIKRIGSHYAFSGIDPFFENLGWISRHLILPACGL